MNYKTLLLIATLLSSFSGIYAALAPEHVVEYPVCPFCFENIVPGGDAAIVMHGEHQAHRECAQPWFVEFNHDACPLCREPVNVAALFPGAHAAVHAPAHHIDFDAIMAAIIAADEHEIHPVAAPALAVDHCHFCRQELGVDPHAVVELPCHHRFHRLCAAHMLVDYTSYHRCPVCDVPVDTIYDLFPAMRFSGLLRHMRDAALLLGGSIIGTYFTHRIAVNAVRSSFSNHWGWRNMFGMGMVGGVGLGVAFGLYAGPRNIYVRFADIFTNAVAASSDVVLVAGGNRDHRVHLITAPRGINFVHDNRILVPACGLWASTSLVHVVSTLINADKLMPRFLDMELADRGRLDFAILVGIMIPFLLGNAWGGALSAAVVGSICEMREVVRILASYWRTRH